MPASRLIANPCTTRSTTASIKTAGWHGSRKIPSCGQSIGYLRFGTAVPGCSAWMRREGRSHAQGRAHRARARGHAVRVGDRRHPSPPGARTSAARARPRAVVIDPTRPQGPLGARGAQCASAACAPVCADMCVLIGRVRASFWRDVMYCNHCADREFGQGPADAARGRRETSPCTLWSPAFVLAYPTEAMQVGGELTSGGPEQEPQGSCPYVAG
jgi:hypothetical protein